MWIKILCIQYILWGDTYNRVYIWFCKYGETATMKRCANKKWCASKHTGLLNSCLEKLCLHPYLVVPLISARVTLISTWVSAHCQTILLPVWCLIINISCHIVLEFDRRQWCHITERLDYSEHKYWLRDLDLMVKSQTTHLPGAGVAKSPSVDLSISKIFGVAKVPFRFIESHSYLPGVTTAELRRYLAVKYERDNQYPTCVLPMLKKIGKKGAEESGLVTPTPDLLASWTPLQ